ncbi:MAG: hypothetical protein RBS39_09700 [Phycisphaerales bacterium]|jgi:hypothetical protein|nr:hypothetical protein [Phycisphaerales bacterium]
MSRATDPPAEILRLGRRLARREAAFRALRAASWGGACGAGVALVAILAERAGVLRLPAMAASPALDGGIASLVAAAVGAMLGAAWSLRARASALSMLIRADASARLSDRLSSAAALGTDNPFADLARRDAMGVLTSVRASSVVPSRVGHGLAVLPAAIVLAVAAAWLVPQRTLRENAAARPPVRPSELAITHAREATELAREAAEDPVLALATPEELERIAEIERELAENAAPDAPLRLASEVQRLAERAEAEAERLERESLAARDALARAAQDTINDPALEAFARALEEGRLDEAASTLDNAIDVARGSGDADPALARDLERLANELERAAGAPDAASASEPARESMPERVTESTTEPTPETSPGLPPDARPNDDAASERAPEADASQTPPAPPSTENQPTNAPTNPDDADREPDAREALRDLARDLRDAARRARDDAAEPAPREDRESPHNPAEPNSQQQPSGEDDSATDGSEPSPDDDRGTQSESRPDAREGKPQGAQPRESQPGQQQPREGDATSPDAKPGASSTPQGNQEGSRDRPSGSAAQESADPDAQPNAERTPSAERGPSDRPGSDPTRSTQPAPNQPGGTMPDNQRAPGSDGAPNSNDAPPNALRELQERLRDGQRARETARQLRDAAERLSRPDQESPEGAEPRRDGASPETPGPESSEVDGNRVNNDRPDGTRGAERVGSANGAVDGGEGIVPGMHNAAPSGTPRDPRAESWVGEHDDVRAPDAARASPDLDERELARWLRDPDAGDASTGAASAQEAIRAVEGSRRAVERGDVPEAYRDVVRRVFERYGRRLRERSSVPDAPDAAPAKPSSGASP